MLEAGDGLAAESRASTFHPPTLEMLSDLGVLDELMALGIVSTGFQYRDRAQGRSPSSTWVSWPRTPPSRSGCRSSSPSSPRSCWRTWRYAGGGCTSTPGRRLASRGYVLGQPPSSPRAIAHRSWLIGADGAHSSVRTSTGAEFDGITYLRALPGRLHRGGPRALLPGIAPSTTSSTRSSGWCCCGPRSTGGSCSRLPFDTPDEVEHGPERIQSSCAGSSTPGAPWPFLPHLASAGTDRAHTQAPAP